MSIARSDTIALTAGQRSNLISLRRTAELADRTQTRLSTGRKVNSVLDDAVAFFRSRSLTDRAEDFDERRAGIQQGIQSVRAALDAIETTESFLAQLRGIVATARTATTSERSALNGQFREVVRQIAILANDTTYQGLSLLNNTRNELDVRFGTLTASRLLIHGFDFNRTVVAAGNLSVTLYSIIAFSPGGGALLSNFFTQVGGVGFSQLGSNNSAISIANAVDAILSSAVTRLRGHAASYGNDVAILQNRLIFTENYVRELSTGSDLLTLADLNEEGANLVALQTRQQLGIQALAVSGQQQQAILRLIQ